MRLIAPTFDVDATPVITSDTTNGMIVMRIAFTHNVPAGATASTTRMSVLLWLAAIARPRTSPAPRPTSNWLALFHRRVDLKARRPASMHSTSSAVRAGQDANCGGRLRRPSQFSREYSLRLRRPASAGSGLSVTVRVDVHPLVDVFDIPPHVRSRTVNVGELVFLRQLTGGEGALIPAMPRGSAASAATPRPTYLGDSDTAKPGGASGEAAGVSASRHRASVTPKFSSIIS